MANTRQSTKRARQEKKRTAANQLAKSSMKAAVRQAVASIKLNDPNTVKEAYAKAVKALSSAATRGTIPSRRASRKISRLTLLVKKNLPQLFAK